MVEVCNKITPETYQNMLEYVKINYENSMKYHDYRKRLEDTVNRFISEN